MPFSVTTADGRTLACDVREPTDARPGAVVLGHAMMVSRRVWSRRGGGLADHLASRGHRVVTFDFRGHGESGPRASREVDWSYDDLVRHDVPAVASAARERFGGPVTLVGHSLGGHVTAAAVGHGHAEIDRLVLVAGNVWLPRWEPSSARRAEKLASLVAVQGVLRAFGRFPTRRLRMGTDDEARTYLGAFFRWWRDDAWISDDGREDHGAALPRVRIPVTQVTSEGDRLNCAPAAGARFLDAMTSADRSLVAVGRGALAGGFVPDHMGLVTDVRSRPVWDEIARHVEGG